MRAQTNSVPRVTRTVWKSSILAAAASIALVAGVAGCASTSPNATASKPSDATLVVSQDGKSNPGANPKVAVPFFITGAKFDANQDVRLQFYAGSDTKGKTLFKTEVKAAADGSFTTEISTSLALGQYAVAGDSQGEKAEQLFQVSKARTPGVTKITYDGVPGALMSPTIANGNVYIAQSASGGSVYQWAKSSLPFTAASPTAAVKPTSSWQPAMPAGIKMEQINFNNAGDQLLITKKAKDINATGGNSVFSYIYGSGEGTQLAGNTAPAGNGYYTWGPGAGPDTDPHNTAEGAFKYTSKAFPTTTPTKVSIGDGGGVVQASNGWYYFASLQSGCVYKMKQDSSWATYVYCIPSWGANNQNQSVYSLAEDGSGNVYAAYQGATNNNTVVLKITPSGSENEDTVSAIQVSGWARTTGLAVNSAGTKVFVNGTSMKQYDTNNTNSILAIDAPKWGDVKAPTATTPASVVTIPGEPWLNGIAYDEAEDIVYAADNTGGFYMNFR